MKPVPRRCPAGGSDAAAGRTVDKYLHSAALASVHEVRPSVDLRFVSYLIIQAPVFSCITAAGQAINLYLLWASGGA